MKLRYFNLDKQKGPGRLMKKGLTLIVIGHVNFILSAILHGSVLRHVSKPSNEISTEYTISNIISVSSGLLVSDLHVCLFTYVPSLAPKLPVNPLNIPSKRE